MQSNPWHLVCSLLALDREAEVSDDEPELLKIPGVRNYLMSSAASSTGIALMLAVLFKQAYDITGDTLTIGIIGLVQFLPAFVLVVVSGYVADRFDRRQVTAVMAVGRVLCALAFFGYSRNVGDVSGGSDAAIWPIYLITLAFGTFDAIAIPARRAIAPLVVERPLLPRLVAAGTVTRVLSGIVGAIASGYLYSAGIGVAYLVVAALFIVSIPLVLRTTYAMTPTRLTNRPTVKMALEGLSFIRRTPIVFSAIALDMFAVLFGGAVALIPVIAEERLGVGDVAYGWLRAAPDIGAGLTAMWIARHPITRRVGPTLLVGVAAFGLFHVTLGLTTNYAIAFGSLMLAAAADMVSVNIRSTLVPVATPDEQLGRVSAVESVFIGASNELGAFQSGVAARYLGVPLTVAGGGVATMAIAAGFFALVPSLRKIDTYDDVTAQSVR